MPVRSRARTCGTRRSASVRKADRGAVTAEAAVALPVLVLVLATALFAVACVAVQLRCVDAARTGARLAARGEGAPAVVAAARAVLPGSEVTLAPDGELVRVIVRHQVRPLGGLLGRLGAVRLDASAIARPEADPVTP